MARSALRDDLPGSGTGPAPHFLPGDCLDLPQLCLAVEPPWGAVPHRAVRLPGRSAGRSGRLAPHHARASRGGYARVDDASGAGPRVCGRTVVWRDGGFPGSGACTERFWKAAVQGGFAHRRFTPAERLALALGRCVPGRVGRLPWHDAVLSWNNQAQFPTAVRDRWPYYVEQNGLTPLAPLAHRLDLVARLDLRPHLPAITSDVLLLQGTDDRIVPRRYFDELRAGLPRAGRSDADGRPPAALHARRGLGGDDRGVFPPDRPVSLRLSRAAPIL